MSASWRTAELETLRTLAAKGTSAEVIARQLSGRTAKAVMRKLSSLGLCTGTCAGRRPKSPHFTVRSWASMTPHEQAAMRRWLNL